MTQQEQEKIVSQIGRICFESALSISKRLEKWADELFGPSDYGFSYDRGFLFQYQIDACDEWFQLNALSLPVRVMSASDSNSFNNRIRNLFYWGNLESSNKLGDVSAVRYMPYVSNGSVRYTKDEETTVVPCSVTGQRREWNHLDFKIVFTPGWNGRDYSFDIDDVHVGDDLNWYLPWHFSLEDDAECPVAPVIVEHVDEYELVVRYRDQQFTLSMSPNKQHAVPLEKDIPVKPTHTWEPGRRPDYTFSLELIISWRENLYGSRDKEAFQSKPHFVRTSDLPPDVRTMQQIDHDAWDYAVRNGLI